MMESGASFSLDRRYRYELTRRWGPGGLVVFTMLNASDADEYRNDPTVRRCIGFGQLWGFGGMVITNIFGLKSMDPALLSQVDDPIGLENDYYLKKNYKDADLAVYAWGNHGQLFDRGRQVYEALGPGFCFGVNRSGEPVHPLYQRRDTKLIDYRRL